MSRISAGRRLAILAMACLALAACDDSAKKAPPAAPPPAVGVMPVALRDVTSGTAFVGRVEAIDKVDLRARVQGFLQQRLFTEGQEVKAGAKLYVIEQEPYKAQVTQAQATLAEAQATSQNTGLQLGRARELVRNQNVSQATADDRAASDAKAKASVLSAQAALEQAQINLSYTEIMAPVTGRIGLSKYSVGNLVGPDSQVLATLVSQDPIYVSFPVSVRKIVEVREHALARGEPPDAVVVRIKLPDGTPYPDPGKVNFVDVLVDRGTDTVIVRATFSNPNRLLTDGQFADVTVEDEKPKPSLVISQAALQADQQGTFVLVVGADKKVEVRRVELGPSAGTGDIVVTGGLKEGEQVIVEGIQKVRPGQVVEPAPAAAAAAAPKG